MLYKHIEKKHTTIRKENEEGLSQWKQDSGGKKYEEKNSKEEQQKN